MHTTPNLPELTKSEFDILRIIWKYKQLSVREVHDQIASANNWAYSTTKTMMDRMVKKGLLTREQFHGVFIYRPLVSRPRGFARLIQYFADRVLELDTATVVSMFDQSNALTAEEIEELNQLLTEKQSGSG